MQSPNYTVFVYQMKILNSSFLFLEQKKTQQTLQHKLILYKHPLERKIVCEHVVSQVVVGLAWHRMDWFQVGHVVRWTTVNATRCKVKTAQG